VFIVARVKTAKDMKKLHGHNEKLSSDNVNIKQVRMTRLPDLPGIDA
jgi:hypothetical protein